MNININQMAQVRLTEEGAKVFNAWDRETQFPGWVPKDLNAGDVFKGHLWHLMQVFGPHIYMGCNVPFEGNEIQLVGVII